MSYFPQVKMSPFEKGDGKMELLEMGKKELSRIEIMERMKAKK